MNFSFKKTLVKGLAILATTFALSANAAFIKTDVIFVVDESGSMSTVQTNLINNIGLFASILTGGSINVDAQFGLVGYGASTPTPRTLTDLTDPASFATAAQGLVISGFTEPAYDAIGYALNVASAYPAGNFSFRGDAVTNIILLTDEPHNGTNTTWATVNSWLQSVNALFNVVTDSSGNSFRNGGTLEALALANGGQLFDLNLFNTTNQQTITDFVTNFANAKLQETIDFCVANPNDPACQNVSVPEPKGLVALALGLLFVRRFAKK